jgi:hypothetical protein
VRTQADKATSSPLALFLDIFYSSIPAVLLREFKHTALQCINIHPLHGKEHHLNKSVIHFIENSQSKEPLNILQQHVIQVLVS